MVHTEPAMERPTKARAVRMVKRMMMVDLEVEGGLLRIVGELSVATYQFKDMGGPTYIYFSGNIYHRDLLIDCFVWCRYSYRLIIDGKMEFMGLQKVDVDHEQG